MSGPLPAPPALSSMVSAIHACDALAAALHSSGADDALVQAVVNAADAVMTVKLTLEGSMPPYPARFVTEGRTRAKLLPVSTNAPSPEDVITLPVRELQVIHDLVVANTPASIQERKQRLVDAVSAATEHADIKIHAIVLETNPYFAAVHADRQSQGVHSRLLVVYELTRGLLSCSPAEVQKAYDSFDAGVVAGRELRWFVRELSTGRVRCVEAVSLALDSPALLFASDNWRSLTSLFASHRDYQISKFFKTCCGQVGESMLLIMMPMY